MKTLKLLLLAAAILSVGSAAVGHQNDADCGIYGRGGKNVITLPPVEGREVLYIDRAQVGPPAILAFWIYQESNGHPGLQTKAGSESAIAGSISTENCTISSGHTNVTKPDTFLF